MKSLIVLIIASFLLLKSTGCKKVTTEPMTDEQENVGPVVDTTGTVGLTDSTDTVELAISPGKIILKNLTWIFPWYNTIEIKEFSDMLSPATSFKVFIQRDSNPGWTAVPILSPDLNPTTQYEYFVESRPDGAGMYHFGSLYIFYYGNDVDDKPSVKIEY